MIGELIDTTHWIERGHTILHTPVKDLPELLERTERELEELVLLARQAPIVGMNVIMIRAALFVPFGSDLWNRKVQLYCRELDHAFQDGPPVPDWEWTLSGLDAPGEARARRELGHGRDTVDLSEDELEAQASLVE